MYSAQFLPNYLLVIDAWPLIGGFPWRNYFSKGTCMQCLNSVGQRSSENKYFKR